MSVFLRRRLSPRAFERPLLETVTPIAVIVDKGIVVNTDDIVAEKLPDGRVILKLHPALARKLGL